jgi:hypothetical protein
MLVNGFPKAKAPFILIVAVAFFIFQLIILVNSFPADYRIANNDFARYSSTGSLMPIFHLGSELTGEVGVILRFAGVCCFLAFTILLLWKKTVSWSLLRKAILLEGIYYLFNTPFIIYLFARTDTSIATYGAAVSYSAQILFVTPIFLVLYRKLRKSNFDQAAIAKWGALAGTGFIFGLWVKHFMLAIYALPLDFSNSAYLAGFLNSTLTMLIAGIIMIATFMPLYKKKSIYVNPKTLGIAFILVGLYATIYVIIALFNPAYMNWISLIDWWTIIFVVLGVGFLASKNRALN